MAQAKVDWYGDEVYLLLEEATAEALEAAAFSVEGKAKMNIVANDQIDTGFMLNSVYAAGQENSTYQNAASSARSQNPQAKMLSEEAVPGDGVTALVAVGAEYAIFQELKNSFLYRALEQEASEVGGILQQKTKSKGF